VAENNASQSATWLAEECGRQLTQVLESMTGEETSVSFAPQEIKEDTGQSEMLWWEQGFNVAGGSPIWVGAVARSWEQIGNRILRSAGVEDSDSESIRSTYLEIIRQALSGVLGTLSTRSGLKAACLEGKEDAPPASGDANGFSFEIRIQNLVLPILLFFSQALVNVQVENHTKLAAESTTSVVSEIAAVVAGAKAGAIELLLDVELPVSVSFGRAHLSLKDVIKLTCGSIVELNRSVSEPVDVIVNNCIIARGEVVVVEGNFGIRIKQVISRQERLRTVN
jgi:flagellar motor switch protein FliN/FliY